MGTMGMFLVMGNAGFASSTVGNHVMHREFSTPIAESSRPPTIIHVGLIRLNPKP